MRAVARLPQVGREAEVVSMFIHTPVDVAFLDAHPALRLVASRSTGTEHIDLDACRARGVAVANVPSYGEHTVAEHTFALIPGAFPTIARGDGRSRTGRQTFL